MMKDYPLLKDYQLDFDANLHDLEADAWFARVEELGQQFGYFEQLGGKHCSVFLEAGNELLVTFENADRVRAYNLDAEPRGFMYARHDGWSHLALISNGESWFRDPVIFEYFDRLIDDGFFEDFEKVLFHGANAGGYAAAAYSVVSPGARVIAMRPQATLDPRLTAWDQRYKGQRRTSFDSRYGFAPQMVEDAENVFLLFDPMQRLDAVHAAMFQSPNVTQLRCASIGAHVDRSFDRMGIHDALIKLVMDGSLDAERFNRLYRARRYDLVYATNLLARLTAAEHVGLAKLLCTYMLPKDRGNFFANKLKELTA